MVNANDIRVPATCECGTKFEIPIAGVELDGFQFTCPGCGRVDRFTDDQIAGFVQQVDAARDALSRAVAESGKRRGKRPH